MINTKAFSSFARERVQFGVHAILAGMGYGLVNYHSPARNEGMQAVRRHKRERRMLLTPVEAYQIFSLVRNTMKLPGELAEVGVYMGASARMIHGRDDFSMCTSKCRASVASCVTRRFFTGFNC